MRGKIVNLCLGIANIAFGVLLYIFTSKVPQSQTELTIQAGIVVNNIKVAIYYLMAVVVIVNMMQYYNHRKDTLFNLAYLLGVFCLSFIFIKAPFVAAFNIVSGLLIIYKSLKENLVELDSTFGISIAAMMIAAALIISMFSLSYEHFAQKIKNKENKGYTVYKENYFEYVTELGINSPYINIKRDGKYGYITPNGDVAIDFLYDFATPFVTISMYNKRFDIALVCQEDTTYIILKNGRIVMSYRTESADDNYGAKYKELEHVYRDILHQTADMQYEVSITDNNINRRPVYQEEPSNNYTFRYNYNDEYDFIVTQSNLGLGDRYELAKKDNLDYRITLNTTNIDYDSRSLNIFSNGYIPFYEVSKLYQGWYTSYGKRVDMRGNAQILEFFDDKILVRDYSKAGRIMFLDSASNPLSPEYKDIYVLRDGRYIVRDLNDKVNIINPDFTPSVTFNYDILDTRLADAGLLIGMYLDNDSEITFNNYGYAKMNYTLLTLDGNVIMDGIEQIYDEIYTLPETSKKKDEIYVEFIKNLKELKYYFVGDKFYMQYLNR